MDDALKIMAALTPVVLGVLTYLTERARRESVEARKVAQVTAERVETTLAESTTATDAKLGEIHRLVNSALSDSEARVQAHADEIVELKRQLAHAERPPSPGGGLNTTP